MKLRKVNTRFMQGNIDVDGFIYDLAVEDLGVKAVMSLNFDFDNAIYSDGFISAIERGMKPNYTLLTESINVHSDSEYHHVIINDICYVIFFNN